MDEQQKPRYSLRWAAGIYISFGEKYSRAINKVNQIYDIDDQMVPVWIATGAKRWLNYKQIVKYLSHLWAKHGPYETISGKVLNKCIVELKFWVNKYFSDR